MNYGAGQTLANLEIKPVDSSFEQYEKQVNTLVAAMSRKEIKKAVLSRTVTLNRPVVSDGQLFFRLAAKYDSAFVSWVNVPGIGRWIGATPETLLDCDGVSLTTMALAGTRKAGAKEPWGQKEQEEQQIVTDYISKVFRDKGLEPIIGEPVFSQGRTGGTSVYAYFSESRFGKREIGRDIVGASPYAGCGWVSQRTCDGMDSSSRTA